MHHALRVEVKHGSSDITQQQLQDAEGYEAGTRPHQEALVNRIA